MPSAEKTWSVWGRRDSPRRNRGNVSFSRIKTLRPSSRRRAAHVDPAGPPPMITTSITGSVSWLRRRAELNALADVRADEAHQDPDRRKDDVEESGHRAD